MKYTGKMYAGVISVARRKVITEVYSEYYPDVIDMIFAVTYPKSEERQIVCVVYLS